ncbi:MAG: outer membrane beta-barrel protein [Verrucomicrobiia bacterium]
MKFNKWTLGLAALGVVSLASAARADEAAAAPKMSQLQTALSNTTLSGYVDTSMEYNPTGGRVIAPVAFQGVQAAGSSPKSNGFSLNVVDIALDKPEDATPWASGYHVETWMGPDAVSLGTQSTGGSQGDFAIRQAYITLNTPIGNGIDWKIGVFDTIIGYESNSSPLNPNFTHSYGYTMEPTTHTGLLATYKFCDALSATVGIADSKGPVINGSPSTSAPFPSQSLKTYMGSVSLTAPSSWGWASGAALTAGVINGVFSGQAANPPFATAGDTTTSWYVGGTLPTPNANLKLGASFDYDTAYNSNNPWAVAGYINFQATPKLSLNGRAEWAKNYLGTVVGLTQNAGGPTGVPLPGNQNAVAFTATLQYNLWANVLTRLEIRWDHASNDVYGGAVGGGGTAQDNAVMIAAQAVYQF